MKNVSDHANAMHKGPHHDMYMHSDNKVSVSSNAKGSHALGDESHIASVMGKPKGADVAGHSGNMGKMGKKY